ncbi:type 2 lanthipeptide synthetase LanM [Kitasatospora cathayae]|uniref:Type 2 lanthipeptide synthetase LanM n=1 Tax=Kitasatospora cathayae TaxID=3004092 RepID=A0ABY7QEW8_9ACTN|nr:type 2 lanthipeptide synthetase LanM [Kitasatospora sp. HUAS 3-15]WBP90636.1 type 2 lanthipeptide synthetase LanM [Kitasatospora sp. HUAS 3-15]
MSEETLETLLRQRIEDKIEDKADVFGGFHRQLLAESARRFTRWDRLAEPEFADFIDLPAVTDALLHAIMAACSDIGLRTIVTAFRSRGTDPALAGMDYDEFHAWAASEHGRKELLGRFPELDRLLRLTAARRVEHARRVLQAAWEDRHLLHNAFATSGRVVSFVPGLGDPHRGGRTVSFVGWENGATAVYKPQQDSAQPLLEAVRSVADADGGFFGPLHPATVARPTHLWQERVQHTDLYETAGPARYFRRFGRVAALLTMLGATDLHNENVIATAEGPVVIDTETLVSLPATQASPLNRELEASVLNTLLFPARFSGATVDVDLSAVGCVSPGGSQKLQSHGLVDAGTDQIRFDQAPAVPQHRTNMATVRGEQLDPRLWVGEITAGFDEARALLGTHRTAIERVVERTSGWSIRQVLRPTYLYARFLEASLHPAHLASPSARADLLAKLPPRHRGLDAPEASDAALRDEVAALLDLDVPFYDLPCDSRQLRGSDGRPVVTASGDPVELPSTPQQAALRSIAAFFDRPAGRDLTYLGYALGSSVDDVWDVRRPPVHAGPALDDAPGWRADLAELVVGEADRPTWLMPRLDGDGLRLGAVDPALHEGGGLLLYLAEAGRAHGTSVIGADPAAVYATAMPPQLPTATTAAALSPFTGALSAVVTGLELRRRGADPARVVPPTLATDIDVRSLSIDDFDYLNGFAGYLLHRAEYTDDNGLPAIGPLLDRLLDLDGPPTGHEGELGLAHGRFGRIAALSALALSGADDSGTDDSGRVREHLDAFASAYLRHRWQDDSLRDAASRSSWCKGYTGVAFAAAKLLRAVGYSAQQAREALAPEVEHIINNAISGDISFCHGAAGRLAMLCWLADRLDWPALRVEAAALHGRFLDRYGEGGWSFGIGSVTDLPSFLYGRSGWYYAQLMLSDRRVELPLCLGGR